MYVHESDVGSTMIEKYFHNCLYFTVARLNRQVTKMAEEEFKKTGLSPSYAFLIMLVNDKPGITQKELCEHMFITQSTISRFVEKLESKGLVIRKSAGKSSSVEPTEKGVAIQKEIEQAWKSLYKRYSKILGKEEGDSLTKISDQASTQLESE